MMALPERPAVRSNISEANDTRTQAYNLASGTHKRTFVVGVAPLTVWKGARLLPWLGSSWVHGSCCSKLLVRWLGRLRSVGQITLNHRTAMKCQNAGMVKARHPRQCRSEMLHRRTSKVQRVVPSAQRTCDRIDE